MKFLSLPSIKKRNVVFFDKFIEDFHVYSTPKDGNSLEDYEDAGGYSKESLCFCLSDGATESPFSKELAALLVDNFVNQPIPDDNLKQALLNTVTQAQSRWLDIIKDRELPWYAEQKISAGSHATFTGLRITLLPAKSLKDKLKRVVKIKWETVGVGDSCFFIVRDNELFKAFPIENVDDFNNTPQLISSIEPLDEERIAYDSGIIQKGDKLYLMTDAMALWFLKSSLNGDKPWDTLQSIDSMETFVSLIDTLRAGKEIKNDDVTGITMRF
ncbi:protein phosphatase 2C domain-containing protein [Candidatus Magnetomonas plexicatena]|uniref:protein phosphatase 2C domain-containing protein n=1 Tax=Candidatus Magnetomonas plexicatena TaxID=2552947 RepID=UPI001C77FC2F|nr:hypothetical protein E2O03_011070 [Nitrospirales bacterium LBB_01]